MSTETSRPVAAAALPTAATVAVLGAHVYGHLPGAFDRGAEAWALAHRTPGLLAGFAFASRVGAPIGVFVAMILAAVLLARGPASRVPGSRLAVYVVAAPALAVLAFNAVKVLVHRTRPAAGLLLPQMTYSFPSGHATVSAAGFLTLGWVLAREARLPAWAAALVGVLPPLVIGASRVYLDVHWATDVIAGWCLGAAIAANFAALYERTRRPAGDGVASRRASAPGRG